MLMFLTLALTLPEKVLPHCAYLVAQPDINQEGFPISSFSLTIL